MTPYTVLEKMFFTIPQEKGDKQNLPDCSNLKFTWAPVDKLSVVNRVNLMLQTLYFSTPAKKRNKAT